MVSPDHIQKIRYLYDNSNGASATGLRNGHRQYSLAMLTGTVPLYVA